MLAAATLAVGGAASATGGARVVLQLLKISGGNTQLVDYVRPAKTEWWDAPNLRWWFTGLSWRGWGNSTTIGTGRYRVCDGAGGGCRSGNVRLRLSALRQQRCGDEALPTYYYRFARGVRSTRERAE